MTRTVAFDPNGWEDYVYWQTQDRKTLKRVNQLITEALRDPATADAGWRILTALGA